jgi:hypothetical protein
VPIAQFSGLLTALGGHKEQCYDLQGCISQLDRLALSKPLLLLIDNVSTTDQVKALLPRKMTKGSLVLATSRKSVPCGTPRLEGWTVGVARIGMGAPISSGLVL